MATAGSGREPLLNETLSGLKCTSKGQLKYNRDLYFNEEQVSLESLLNDSIDSVIDVNASILALSSEDITNKTEIEVSNRVRETRKPLGLPINFDNQNERNIKEFHDRCRENAEQRKKEWAQILMRRIDHLKQENEEILRNNQEVLAEEKRQFDLEISEWEKISAEELQQRKVELDEEAKEHKRKLDEILTKCLIEESHLARKEEEKKTALKNLKKNIVSLYHQIIINIEIIQEKFSKHMALVDAQVYEEIEAMLARISTKSDAIAARCKALTEPCDAENHLEAMNKLMQALLSIDHKVAEVIKSAQEKAVAIAKIKEIEKAAKIEREKQEEEMKRERDRKLAEIALKAENEEKLPKAVDKTSETPEQKMAHYISENALAEYIKLQEHLKTLQASLKDFTSDPRQTKYKFDLQKAVNIPINALSAHSPSQLNDKIFRLVTLLSGDSVEVGGRKVNCKAHPSAMMFCKELVAKKLVAQGAQQVSSNPSSAFLYAAVIVGIWTAFPDVGVLILAHFHKSYPYLVPYYMPQVEGQSTNDYHKALGYSVSNDKIEDENHFLSKLSGTVQLYAAVLSSKGATTPDHPHGIDKAWVWLARTLNLKPHPSITATMLFEFIKVSGHLLQERFGKQFQKMLLMLCKDFIPAIEKVTPAEKQGPTQRLKDFLEECIKHQRIAIPKGYLTERWWHTGHF